MTYHISLSPTKLSILTKLWLILFFTGFLVFAYAEVWGADWKLYEVNDTGINFYDAESITHPSENVFRVWEKYAYTEKGVIEMAIKLGEKYRTIDQDRVLREFDCKERKWTFLQMVSYSKNGSIISSGNVPRDWEFVVPGSITDTLLKILCKTTTE